ncbi:MAG: alpha/beta fold hydrolase [Methylobacteriaceae bacterium]|nr:alpha/beta fold hydrolase [Methylobacteriaceae bacterium]
MFKTYILRPSVVLFALFALFGLAVAVLAAMIARPLLAPPPLESILKGARAVDASDAPALSYFVARDGTQLGFRVYEPAGEVSGPAAILIHGSAGGSLAMHLVGKALSAAGVRAIAPDLRGHGVSGTRGDIAYIGQSEDDLADLLDHLKFAQKPALVGFSSGGGFAARIAHAPLGEKFSRFTLVSPFLGIDAPTARPSTGGARWTSVDTPRIVALTILHRLGIECCEQLPVLAFALPHESRRFVTTRYSFRLLSSFGPKDMRYRDLSGIEAPIEIVAGADDELMVAGRYADVAQTGARARVTIVPGVDHMGATRDPAALAAIVAATKGEGK